MSLQTKTDLAFSAKDDRDIIDDLLRAISEQFDVIMGNEARVASVCTELKLRLPVPLTEADQRRISALLPLLAKRAGPLAQPVFELFHEIALVSSNPWPLVKGLLSVLDDTLAARTLKLTAQLADQCSLIITHEVISVLAEEADTPGKPLNDPAHIVLIGEIVRKIRTNDRDPVLTLFIKSPKGNVRRLAARILDSSGEPVSGELTETILGREASVFLLPYLAYTRATHTDLLSLLSLPGKPPPSLPLLREAHTLLGENLLRQIISDLGWSRVNLGLSVRHYVRASIGDSIPLMLYPAEAALFAYCGESRPTSDVLVAVAHGTAPIEEDAGTNAVDPATKFRLYNLAHAELLADFLAVAPLTIEKVHAIVERMDRVVKDFVELFSEFSEECGVLPDAYANLKNNILQALDRHSDHGPLSPELTRLVMMFEDPRSVSEAQTLHGLKRYLHQKGLQLGFRLVLRSRSTNRTVDLILASGGKILPNTFKGIRYTDFEPDNEAGLPETHIPYPISVVAEGFIRQLIYGQENFPRVDIFCYGNEVHYYLSFRNHPAFLRINYAPPLQGGMIDLEYFGVSKYELSVHPNLALDALKRFFEYLEFDIQIENTRVHARYDKEHAHDLESLCHKVEGIFRLAPYLLEIDWTIGSLELDAEARRIVANAWAAAFAHWGILPLHHILTSDRTGIIESIDVTPAGKKEIIWKGDTPYSDRLVMRPNRDFYERLCETVDKLDIDITPARSEEGHRRFGQIRLERWLLFSLRKAVARGELVETPEGYRRTSSDLFQRVHEVDHFAAILQNDEEQLSAFAALAQCLEPLERIVDFRTTGYIGGFDVQFARLPLRGDELGMYILRGEKNAAALAFYSHGTVLFRRRKSVNAQWGLNARCDVEEFLTLLRRANYPTGVLDYTASGRINELRQKLQDTSLVQRKKLIRGEKIITGLSASPGRAVGRILFEITGKKPEDFNGHILVAAAIRPEDNAFIYHAAGVISTGGGILSHAGLLATQFHKPAVIIAGRWEPQKDGPPILRYTGMEYELEEKNTGNYKLGLRKRIREREHILYEGDLVVIDAIEGRVSVLGQGRDALALHEALFQFGKTSQGLAMSTADHDILNWRGKRLRARQQIEKILGRLIEPVLACHAVYELLLGRFISNRTVPASEKAGLFQVVMNNPYVGETARDHLLRIIEDIHQRFQARYRKAIGHIPVSNSIYEILNLRLDVIQTKQALDEAEACLRACGIKSVMPDTSCAADVESPAYHRIKELHDRFCNALVDDVKVHAQQRHLLRDIERIGHLIKISDEQKTIFTAMHQQLMRSDAAVFERLAERNVIRSEDGGFELYPLIGWKAANLGEIGKIAGHDWVPPWFAVTDRAFRHILDTPVDVILKKGTEIPTGTATLRQAIEQILSQPKVDAFQKSTHISNLWDAVILPQQLSENVITAYRMVAAPGNSGEQEATESFVAIRSSSCEEDAEIAARAGEFETFLFIRGENAVLDYLKRTWSGLWSERAIHNRTVLGSTASAGGGVIVQRMVCSRISGVLQTVNVGRNEMGELVINAGLGLGEGIVSGIVAADQIVVSKEQDPQKEHLRFTYVTADKKEYVIFNKRAGLGTIRCEAPYHKRLRPALEYVELCELVGKALALESAYGYPLDIEFGIEGAKVWILQARPVPIFLTALQETLHKYPLTEAKSRNIYIKGEEEHDQT